MTNKTIMMVSKSIAFQDVLLEKMDALAARLGMTRLQGGEEIGDTSKIVRRLCEFALDNESDFLRWQAGVKAKR